MSQGWDQPNDDAETALPWSGVSDDIADQPTPAVESLLPEPLAGLDAGPESLDLAVDAGKAATTPADADPRPLLALADEPTPVRCDPTDLEPARSSGDAEALAVHSEAPRSAPAETWDPEKLASAFALSPAGHSPSATAVSPSVTDHWPQAMGDCLLPPAPSPVPAAPASTGGGWTIPLLCAGIALIAACVIIPLCDNNRHLAYERQRLKQELDYVMRQVDVNHDFLHEVSRDPTLAQRLAQRQMKVVREGTAVLQLQGEQGGNNVSPFLLVHVAPPPRLAPYRPLGGQLAQLCLNSKSQLYLLGTGLLLTAAGLVLGGTAPGAAPLDAEDEG
jgi:hypothetical protein